MWSSPWEDGVTLSDDGALGKDSTYLQSPLKSPESELEEARTIRAVPTILRTCSPDQTRPWLLNLQKRCGDPQKARSRLPPLLPDRKRHLLRMRDMRGSSSKRCHPLTVEKAMRLNKKRHGKAKLGQGLSPSPKRLVERVFGEVILVAAGRRVAGRGFFPPPPHIQPQAHNQGLTRQGLGPTVPWMCPRCRRGEPGPNVQRRLSPTTPPRRAPVDLLRPTTPSTFPASIVPREGCLTVHRGIYVVNNTKESTDKREIYLCSARLLVR